MIEERAPAVHSVARPRSRAALWATLRSSHLIVVLPVATAFLFLLAWQAIAAYGEIPPSDPAAANDGDRAADEQFSC